MKVQADLSALNAQTIDKLARLEFALQQFVAEKVSPRLASSAGRPSRKFTVYPVLCHGRLTDSGVMASCRSGYLRRFDHAHPVPCFVVQSIAHFIDWTIQHQKFADTLLAWHCGNAPPSLACKAANLMSAITASSVVPGHRPVHGHRRV